MCRAPERLTSSRTTPTIVRGPPSLQEPVLPSLLEEEALCHLVGTAVVNQVPPGKAGANAHHRPRTMPSALPRPRHIIVQVVLVVVVMAVPLPA